MEGLINARDCQGHWLCLSQVSVAPEWLCPPDGSRRRDDRSPQACGGRMDADGGKGNDVV
ncbi:MAG: hypothetical protein J6X65_07495 [Bacteroidales bacterium]|nr:hypothetical protein [Bacteroidales bacterium]